MDNHADLIWEKVKTARHPKRPTAIHLIKHLFSDFVELHGDRAFGDDASMITGLATLEGMPITVIAQEKGVDTEDKIKRNFGMPHPEGYKKALRMMRQAEKFRRPILCIVDTPGAYPGIKAEERGQATAIAENLKAMMFIKTPIIVVVLGEGGSGGALAIGVGDHMLMFENSIYSILSPEGFATILFKDSTKAKDAAVHMKLTAEDLKVLGIIDDMIEEKEGLHVDPTFGYAKLKEKLLENFKILNTYPHDELVEKRYQKFRKMGIYKHEEAADVS